MIAIAARMIIFIMLPLMSEPMPAAFIRSIPMHRGITSATSCSPLGKSSYGMVAPEKNNIGEYKMEAATFKLLGVLHRAAAGSPMENMEIRVIRKDCICSP